MEKAALEDRGEGDTPEEEGHVSGPSPIYMALFILFIFLISLLVPGVEKYWSKMIIEGGRSELAARSGFSVLVVAAIVAAILCSLVHSALSLSVFEHIERGYPGLKRGDYIVNQLIQNVLLPLLVAVLLFYLL